MNDEELIKRFRAALGYAGLSVAQLAERLDERGLGSDTLYDIRQGRRNVSPIISVGEQTLIARACGLPEEFFVADFVRLGEIAEARRADFTLTGPDGPIAEIETKAASRDPDEEGGPAYTVLVHLGERLEEIELNLNHRLSAIEDELGLRDAARSTHQALVQALDAADEAETQAAPETRDEADASSESAPARARGKRSSAQRPGA